MITKLIICFLLSYIVMRETALIIELLKGNLRYNVLYNKCYEACKEKTYDILMKEAAYAKANNEQISVESMFIAIVLVFISLTFVRDENFLIIILFELMFISQVSVEKCKYNSIKKSVIERIIEERSKTIDQPEKKSTPESH